MLGQEEGWGQCAEAGQGRRETRGSQHWETLGTGRWWSRQVAFTRTVEGREGHRVPSRGTPRVPAPLPLSPFSPPDRDRRGDSPAWSGRGSREKKPLASQGQAGAPNDPIWIYQHSPWTSTLVSVCLLKMHASGPQIKKKIVYRKK